ncbi:acetyl-CoA carboxylase biotin carboxylase subunit [Pseudooceanicola aestuarii]|uniref:acetyl-CoA carboxylase biotin carboxylase subunit n=1 Tax=Pseudooceanicola aestuarii TaxID=2697319 RepID=UPI0013D14CF0|nr:acetyl-CoA carboxylase biotin carboxylase subunit [Pseudooceanicola aestuarii]
MTLQPTPFSKLLVANRGEIALRVIRSARAMGLRTVAVFSEADAEAEHVRQADEAVCIGAAAPAQSYLRIDAIIAAARTTGADAIHPGYGFLAENADLPAACDAAGIVFVGPDAEAIRAMGDKAGAKALMIAADVPCVPGYQGDDQSEDRLLAEARQIGFPVMIKAVAGGGGRGMRLVSSEAEFADALTSARSEAAGAFGNDVVLLEKAIVNPRHVEIQVMADRHGNVVHCGERDCSVQRRHQKVIEEAPSPAVGPELRARMGAASVAAVRAIGYVGAGTFEYLLDDQGNFYFMEMNTRLQVEHPVTEAITGLDLVALQLRVAAGEVLPLEQDDITFDGHAMEVRLCAEDPAAGFMPQSGRIDLWEPSGAIRVDHALRSGAGVPPHYDSMIAKLIAHGPTRDAARQRLQAALADTAVTGLRTNRDFLGDCLAHPVFAEGQATTAFVGDHGDDLLALGRAAEPRAAMVAAALLRAGPGSRLGHGYPAPLRLGGDSAEYQPMVQQRRDGATRVEMAEMPPLDLRVTRRDGAHLTVELDGALRAALLTESGAGPDRRITLQIDGRCHDFADLTFAPVVTAGAAGGDGKVRATMNGSVVSVDVAPGDRVEPGQKVAVVEAMKMEHTHAATIAGHVSAVHVTPGTQVGAHMVMVEIDPA